MSKILAGGLALVVGMVLSATTMVGAEEKATMTETPAVTAPAPETQGQPGMTEKKTDSGKHKKEHKKGKDAKKSRK